MSPSSIEEIVAEALENVTSEANRQNLTKSVEQVNVERSRLGMNELAKSLDQEADGAPACDSCGKEGSGTLQCSRCQAAFYCSKDCQRNAWKLGGHKAACGTMKEEVEATGLRTVKRMCDLTLPTIIRVQGLDEIDGSGPYRAAIKEGLHAAMKALFQDDLDASMNRYRRGGEDICFATQYIMSKIFRGQRREGKGQTTGGNFRCIDGQRIQAYVASSPDAFDVWFNASLQVYRVMLDEQVFRNDRQCQQQARNSARDVWAAWIFVFVNKRASKEILIPKGAKENPQLSVDRVESIAVRIKGILNDRWSISSADAKDPNSTLEGMMNQIVAQINYWCKHFEIPVDFEKLIDYDETHHHMYLQLAKPLGEATVRKGFSLTMDETRAAIAAYAPKNTTGGNNKKRGGKKGRGRR
jgi:hypothetical protein